MHKDHIAPSGNFSLGTHECHHILCGVNLDSAKVNIYIYISLVYDYDSTYKP